MDKSIVFVVNTLAIGGAAKIVSFVANIATKIFENVYIIVYDNREPAHILNKSINVIYLNLNEIKENNKNLFLSKVINRCRWIRKIRKNIKLLNPDVVMPFITDVIVDTFIAMIGYKSIYVASERGDPTSYPLKWKFLSKLIYPLYNSIVFQTEGARQYFDRFTMRKGLIIENPYFNKIEYAEPYPKEREKYIVSAGRFVPEKGFDDLIKAFSTINVKYPNYKLVIYGEGHIESELKKLISDLNLNNAVSLKGYEKNVVQKFYNCEVFVLSSLSEGIPNILIEAMAIGMPVISTDCKPGGAASLIKDGKNGILVPISDPNKLADAIEYLINNKEVATKLGEEAFKIKEELNPELLSRKWITFFESLTN